MTRCVVLGTMRVSACAPAKRCAHLRSTQSRAGGSKRDDSVYVREKIDTAARQRSAPPAMPGAVVIVGGAASNAAAEALRREGYSGRVTVLSADDPAPYDRPNLSKNHLSGNAPEEWIPLRSPDFYQEQDIDLRLSARVAVIDTTNRHVQLEDGSRFGYDALLLATGAEPVRLDGPGAQLPHVRYLRTLADTSTRSRCMPRRPSSTHPARRPESASSFPSTFASRIH
jgi:hypothetical protein